jgi:hypothetical protein
VLGEVTEILAAADLKSSDVKAGCARCGACSSLRAREVGRA